MSESMKVGESITFSLAVIGGGFLLHTFGKHIDSGLLMMFGAFGIFGGILSFFINLIQRAAEKHERGEDTGIWKPLYYIGMIVAFLFFAQIIMGWNITHLFNWDAFESLHLKQKGGYISAPDILSTFSFSF